MLDPWFIQIGNMLIAQLLENKDGGYYQLPPEIVEAEGYGIANIDHMKFHKSWDWLMPILKLMDSPADCFDFDIEKCWENVVYELQGRLRNPL